MIKGKISTKNKKLSFSRIFFRFEIILEMNCVYDVLEVAYNRLVEVEAQIQNGVDDITYELLGRAYDSAWMLYAECLIVARSENTFEESVVQTLLREGNEILDRLESQVEDQMIVVENISCEVENFSNEVEDLEDQMESFASEVEDYLVEIEEFSSEVDALLSRVDIIVALELADQSCVIADRVLSEMEDNSLEMEEVLKLVEESCAGNETSSVLEFRSLEFAVARSASHNNCSVVGTTNARTSSEESGKETGEHLLYDEGEFIIPP